jgi:hypothetical protein
MSTDEHIRYVPESAAINNRLVLAAGAAALLLVAGTIAGFYLIYNAAVPEKSVPAPQQFSAPRVVTHDQDVAQLRRLRDEQSERLQTWRWANDQHSLVQIPIDRAMELLVQKGADAYAPLASSSALSAPRAAAQQAPSGQRP